MRTIGLTIAIFVIEAMALHQGLVAFAMKLGHSRDTASSVVWSMMFSDLNIWTIAYAVAGIVLAYITASFIIRR